jgi:LysR family carnitine catabolism transcriptional activator
MSLMNVQPRQLVAFLEVCRLESFSKAAERIPMSQSGLSMLIKELEGNVGTRLFDRTTRSVTPTAAGRKLQAAAARILGELGSFDRDVAGDRSAVASRLAVSATPMVSANLLPPTLSAFAAARPNVTVDLFDVGVEGVRQRVLEGQADIGLGFFIKPAVGMRRTPICKFRLMLVSPVDDGVAGLGLGRGRSWSSMKRLPLIGLPAGNPIQSVIEMHLDRIGRGHEPRPVVNLVGTLVAMVEAGLGHAIVPTFVLPDCQRRHVSVSMLIEPVVSIDLHCATRVGTVPTELMGDFTKALERAAIALSTA